MCTVITVIRRYIPRSQLINIAGSKLNAHMVVAMETSSAFLRRISKGTVFLRMDWRNMKLVRGEYFTFLACYVEKIKNSTDTIRPSYLKVDGWVFSAGLTHLNHVLSMLNIKMGPHAIIILHRMSNVWVQMQVIEMTVEFCQNE